MRGPLRMIAAAVLLVPASCGQEPGFDERYQQHSSDIEAAARNMQWEMDNRMEAGNRVDAARGGLPAQQP